MFLQEARSFEAITGQACALLHRCAGASRLCLVLDNAEVLFSVAAAAAATPVSVMVIALAAQRVTFLFVAFITAL